MLYSMVLAGGRSSRMGRDKRLLGVAGKTLLERALELLGDTGADRIFISGEVPGYHTVPDLRPFSGPPGGLYSTLHYLKREFGLDGSPLLIIPVDMPVLGVEALARLVVSLGEAQAIHYETEVFPCIFRATDFLHEHLGALVAGGFRPGGSRSMKGLLAAARARTISARGLPDHTFLNVNRPEEWERFRRGEY